MIYYNDIKGEHDYISFFKYLQELASDKKYKLPYFNHNLRRVNLIINDKVEIVYLSTWSLKNNRRVDGKDLRYSIIETFENNYVLMISNYNWHFPKIQYIEGLKYIPTLGEIDKLVSGLKWGDI